jgi:hypothetical protein
MHLSRTWFALLLVVVMAGCTRPDQKANPDDGVSTPSDDKRMTPQVSQPMLDEDGRATAQPIRDRISPGATFFVESLKGEGTYASISQLSQWKVPSSIQFGFSACLRSSIPNTPLLNQPFTVSIPGSDTTYKADTNGEGCITWNESMPYNFFAGRSGWVAVERDIIGRGVNRGRVTVTLALNPWAVGDLARDKGCEVVYMQNGCHGWLPQNLVPLERTTLYLAGEAPKQPKAEVFVQSVNLRANPIAETGKSIRLLYQMEMKPRIRTLRFNNVPEFEKVIEGDFEIEFMLIANNVASNRKVLLQGEQRVHGRVVDGSLIAELSFDQSIQVNQGNMELVMRVRPMGLGSDESIKPFTGVYRLGPDFMVRNGDGIVNKACIYKGPIAAKGMSESDNSCSYDKIMEEASNFQDLRDRGYVRNNERYRFTNLKLRFLMVLPGETATQRTVSYTASTCITDIQTNLPLAFTPMVINYEKSSALPNFAELKKNDQSLDENDSVELAPIPQTTDQNGCLNWTGRVFHKYYAEERYLQRNIKIEKESGFSHNFTFYVNPWDTNINFGFDKREFNQDTVDRLSKRRTVPSRFFLGDFGYHTVGFLYNIDPFMELEVKKTVLMEMVPQVLRYSGIKDARKMTEHLRDGIYMLKVAIQKNYLDPRDNSRLLLKNNPELQQTMMCKLDANNPNAENKVSCDRSAIGRLSTREYITTNMALVRIVDGMIIYPIELTMRDLRLMRVRANFIVQLETVDERLIQAFHVFKSRGLKATDLEQKLEDFKATLKSVERATEGLLETQNNPMLAGAELSPELKALMLRRDSERKDLSAATKYNLELIKRSLKWLQTRLDGGVLSRWLNNLSETGSIEVDPGQGGGRNHACKRREKSQAERTDEMEERNKNGFPFLDEQLHIVDNFCLEYEDLKRLKGELEVNDFSTVELPKREELDIPGEAEEAPEVSELPRELYSRMERLCEDDRPERTEAWIQAQKDVKDKGLLREKVQEVCAHYAKQRTKGLNIFVEHNSGLRRRSFVGPVIFLSNAYKDSVRATDNLDEAKCHIKQDVLAQSIEQTDYSLLEEDEVQKTVVALEGKRQNNAYRYNKFFGSLRHLCDANVDDLIRSEKKLRTQHLSQMAAASLKFNFANQFNFPLDFVSLTDEPLKQLKPGCTEFSKECLVATDKGTLPAAKALELVNRNNGWIRGWYTHALESVGAERGRTDIPSKDTWTAEELPKLFFTRNMNTRYGLCNLVRNRILDRTGTSLGAMDRITLASGIESACEDEMGLIHDIKMRVEQTGNYTFLGGLNLNFNVGESFSMGWSSSWSWGAELTDMIGAAMGTVGGWLGQVGSKVAKAATAYGVKPFNLKYGTGMSNSEGTSVSESTYLVSQIAKFQVDLTGYEKCAVARLSEAAARKVFDTILASTYSKALRNSADLQRKLYDNIESGFFVCEGATRANNKTRTVDEMYFYFTQHFTEGDMLDQADLYNHPWLLAMRGMRDFTVFVTQIRAQELVNFTNFAKGVLGLAEKRDSAWALEHTRRLYYNVLPSFPGFYTVLDRGEDICAFPLQQGCKLSKSDSDPLGEVNRQRTQSQDGKPVVTPAAAASKSRANTPANPNP